MRNSPLSLRRSPFARENGALAPKNALKVIWWLRHPSQSGGSGPPAGSRFRRMQEILDAIVSGASGDDIAAAGIPESFRAAFVTRDESTMFEGLDSSDKDPRKSLHVDDVSTPELAPDEAF